MNKRQRREAKLAAEAEAMGMTLDQARAWWAEQREGPFVGRPAVRLRRARVYDQECIDGKHGAVAQYVHKSTGALNNAFRNEIDRMILYGDSSGPERETSPFFTNLIVRNKAEQSKFTITPVQRRILLQMRRSKP